MSEEKAIHRLDYDIIDGLDERKNGRFKFTDDFHRLRIFTERIQEFLEEKTGKKVPLMSLIELTKEESDSIRSLISEEHRFIGLLGSYRAEALNSRKVGEFDKDCLATEKELHCDYKWGDL